MTENKEPFESYAAFWPFYLSQHAKRTARLLHVWGALLALVALWKAVTLYSLGWLLMVPIFGYGFAWAAHAFVENNRPATFSHPLWSLRGDAHMLWLWLTGRLEIELVRHNIYS